MNSVELLLRVDWEYLCVCCFFVKFVEWSIVGVVSY